MAGVGREGNRPGLRPSRVAKKSASLRNRINTDGPLAWLIASSRRLRVFPGQGTDTTGLRDYRARQGFDISDAGSAANIGLLRTSASGTGAAASYVGTSSAADRLEIIDSAFDAFSARLKSGDDAAYLRGPTFATASPIDGGVGTNDVGGQIVVSWDFSKGLQGWTPGIVRGRGTFPNSTFETVAEQQGFVFDSNAALSETGLDSRGIRIQDTDTDEFVTDYLFLTRRLDSEFGLLPESIYTVATKYTIITQGVENAHFNGVTSTEDIANNQDEFNRPVEVGSTPDSDAVLTTSDNQQANPSVIDDRSPLENDDILHVLQTPQQTLTTDAATTAWPVIGFSFNAPNGATPFPTFLLAISYIITPVRKHRYAFLQS